MKTNFFLRKSSFALFAWLTIFISLSMYSTTRMNDIYTETMKVADSAINSVNNALDIASTNPLVATVTKINPGKKKNIIPTSDLDCMADNIYYEAGNQSYVGKLAVGHVVLNRAARRGYPSTICGVVYDGANNARTTACQFSWTCAPRNSVDKSSNTWRESLRVAKALLDKSQEHVDITEGAAWYHADYVSPPWSKRLRKVATIDNHIFYK